jgi:hypothetical protein
MAGEFPIPFTIPITFGSSGVGTGTKFKLRAGKATTTIQAVKDSNGTVFQTTISSTYTPTDANEVWLLRHIFSSLVEEV